MLLQEKNFAAAFAHFDRDGSGSLTTDEIRAALATLGVTDEEVHVSPHAQKHAAPFSLLPVDVSKCRCRCCNTWRMWAGMATLCAPALCLF